ncbi:MAG: BON domain-containing protein [Magnetococcales bacterium]|nr:BON domain-containing protein [Magnetococcales bacterium]
MVGKRQRILLAVVSLVSLLSQTACAPVVVLGAGVLAGSTLLERRGAGESLEDHWVALKLRSSFVESEEVRAGNINVSVFRGKVLLTGTASTKEEIDEAIRIARYTRGVQAVSSELQIEEMTPKEVAEDTWITGTIKMKILADEVVRGLDIHVETTKKVVYLTGIAGSVRERDRAVEISRVRGVREVVSYIDVDTRFDSSSPDEPSE